MLMADQSASERAYVRLKQDILGGALTAGPLDLRAISDKLRMSVTPVREALARLSAERLVKLAPHQGYAVASLSSRRLENLYEFAAGLVDMSILRCISRIRLGGPPPETRPPYRTYAEGMSAVVRDIGAAQPNLELRDHLFALDDRLQPTRRCEPAIFAGCDEELTILAGLWDQRRLISLQRRFRDHFERRIDSADALVRLLAEPAGDG